MSDRLFKRMHKIQARTTTSNEVNKLILYAVYAKLAVDLRSTNHYTTSLVQSSQCISEHDAVRVRAKTSSDSSRVSNSENSIVSSELMSISTSESILKESIRRATVDLCVLHFDSIFLEAYL